MKNIVLSVALFASLMTLVGCNSATHAIDVPSDAGTRPPVKVSDADAYKPTPLADRVILTWTGDPAKTQAVTWRTDTTIAQGSGRNRHRFR